jgi:hypothetical protein
MAVNRTISWNTFLFLHSLRLIPPEQRLDHLTDGNRKFYGHYARLKKKHKREPSWGELGAAAKISSPPSIANNLFRLRYAGLIPDFKPTESLSENRIIIPDDLAWEDAFARLLDLVGGYAQDYPDDVRNDLVLQAITRLGMPPKLYFDEAPDWYNRLYRDLYRAESQRELHKPGSWFLHKGQGRKRDA